MIVISDIFFWGGVESPLQWYMKKKINRIKFILQCMHNDFKVKISQSILKLKKNLWLMSALHESSF